MGLEIEGDAVLLALGERRGRAERDRIPVDDDWDIPKDSRAWRGQQQLGSLGGGNHFIELQHDGALLWVMFHTGSRGFGHGLASYYFERAQQELVQDKEKEQERDPHEDDQAVGAQDE